MFDFDIDNDGIDNDGLMNYADDMPRDHDNDCLNDALDDDDDNDGHLDVDEQGGEWSFYRYDHDNDGYSDLIDTDDDNDGLSDWFEMYDGNDLTGQLTTITTESTT